MITREELIEKMAKAYYEVEFKEARKNMPLFPSYKELDSEVKKGLRAGAKAALDALISSLPEIRITYLNDREPKASEITGDTARVNYQNLLRMKK